MMAEESGCAVDRGEKKLLPNSNIPGLLQEINDLIVSGMPAWRAAAEKMAIVLDQGATRQDIADYVGMSRPWVSQMLKWRREKYVWPTPFGLQSKASRLRAKRQSADARSKKKDDTKQNQGAAAARARSETAKAEADEANYEGEKASIEAIWGNAEAGRAEATSRAEAAAWAAWKQGDHSNVQKFHPGSRALLVKALGLLGSEHAGERDSAARVVERIRKSLCSTWDELIVQVYDNDLDDDCEGPFDDCEEAVA